MTNESIVKRFQFDLQFKNFKKILAPFNRLNENSFLYLFYSDNIDNLKKMRCILLNYLNFEEKGTEDISKDISKCNGFTINLDKKYFWFWFDNDSDEDVLFDAKHNMIPFYIKDFEIEE